MDRGVETGERVSTVALEGHAWMTPDFLWLVAFEGAQSNDGSWRFDRAKPVVQLLLQAGTTYERTLQSGLDAYKSKRYESPAPGPGGFEFEGPCLLGDLTVTWLSDAAREKTQFDGSTLAVAQRTVTPQRAPWQRTVPSGEWVTLGEGEIVRPASDADEIYTRLRDYFFNDEGLVYYNATAINSGQSRYPGLMTMECEYKCDSAVALPSGIDLVIEAFKESIDRDLAEAGRSTHPSQGT